MLSKCVQCGFYIRKNDEFCLNCGLKEPTKDSQPQIQTNIPLIKLLRSRKTHFLVFLLSSFIFLMFQGIFYFRLVIFTLVLVLIAIFSFWVLDLIGLLLLVEKPKKKIRQPSKNSLNGKSQTISHRIFELESRKEKINELVLQIGEFSTGKLADTREKLISANQIISNQVNKYKLQKHKIELVRLQNQVLPYSLYFNHLDEFKTEDAVIVSEQTIREVGKIREDLSGNFSNKDDFEFRNFMRNLDETSKGCEKLWEALLNKQAMFALKDVQPLENLNALPQTNELAHAIETFNIESTLNDFSESFEQLETEYKRLLADNEVSQKLLNYEN